MGVLKNKISGYIKYINARKNTIITNKDNRIMFVLDEPIEINFYFEKKL
jgi:hypothetical protein